MRPRKAVRNPVVRQTTHRPVKVVHYSATAKNIDNWAQHQRQWLAHLQNAAEELQRKQAERKALRRKRARQHQNLKQRIRRAVALSIPLATLVSYLAYRLYGLTRTFSH